MPVDRPNRDILADYLAARMRGEQPALQPREILSATSDHDLEHLGRIGIGLVDPPSDAEQPPLTRPFLWDVATRIIAYLRSDLSTPPYVPRSPSRALQLRYFLGFLVALVYFVGSIIGVVVFFNAFEVNGDVLALILPGVPVAIIGWWWIAYSDGDKDRDRYRADERSRELRLDRPWPFASTEDYERHFPLLAAERLPPSPGPYVPPAPRHTPRWLGVPLAILGSLVMLCVLFLMWPIVAVALGIAALTPRETKAALQA